jgi:hypothetical protein
MGLPEVSAVVAHRLPAEWCAVIAAAHAQTPDLDWPPCSWSRRRSPPPGPQDRSAADPDKAGLTGLP